MATTVNIHEAKAHLSKLVERAAKGEEIIIAKESLWQDSTRSTQFPTNLLQSADSVPRRGLFTEAEIEALLDPALDKEIEDLLYNGPLFPGE